MDLFFDKIPVVIGVFDVLGVVSFKRLDAVSGLTGYKNGSGADRVEKAHVRVSGIIERSRPGVLEPSKHRQPFALVKVATSIVAPCGVVNRKSSGSTFNGFIPRVRHAMLLQRRFTRYFFSLGFVGPS